MPVVLLWNVIAEEALDNDLLKGIYQSCNTYFANTYKKIINKYDTPDKGVNQWNSHLKSFGLGNYLGYDLSVGKRGFIPNAAYYNSWYKEGGWKAPTIISNAIGQGEVLTTPIQLANFHCGNSQSRILLYTTFSSISFW